MSAGYHSSAKRANRFVGGGVLVQWRREVGEAAIRAGVAHPSLVGSTDLIETHSHYIVKQWVIDLLWHEMADRGFPKGEEAWKIMIDILENLPAYKTIAELRKL